MHQMSLKNLGAAVMRTLTNNYMFGITLFTSEAHSLEPFWRNHLWNSSNGLISFSTLSPVSLATISHFPFCLQTSCGSRNRFDGSTLADRILTTISQLLVLATPPKALWLWFCSQLVWVSITLPGGAEFHNHLIINRKTNSKPTLCLHPTFQMTQKIFYLCKALFKFLTSTKRKVSQ